MYEYFCFIPETDLDEYTPYTPMDHYTQHSAFSMPTASYHSTSEI